MPPPAKVAYDRGLTGFTLAEVLITLGIIGVVAALTMPALIANHKKTVVETRLAKFYSTINQAIIRSEADNGSKEFWDTLETGYENDDDGNEDISASKVSPWFERYLKPYLQLTEYKVDGNSEGKVLAYFADGSMTMISGSSFIFYPNAKDYERLENEGTVSRNKNMSGTKYFTFFFKPYDNSSINKYHFNKGVEPYKYEWDGTREMLLNNGTIGCKENVSNERAYCTALIQMNGWKIPKDYPLRF